MIRSSEIWCCQWFGYMGEVMTSSVTFVYNSIGCFYPSSVLRVKFVSWQEYGPNGYWKLLTLRANYKPVILKLFLVHSPLCLVQAYMTSVIGIQTVTNLVVFFFFAFTSPIHFHAMCSDMEYSYNHSYNFFGQVSLYFLGWGKFVRF